MICRPAQSNGTLGRPFDMDPRADRWQKGGWTGRLSQVARTRQLGLVGGRRREQSRTGAGERALESQSREPRLAAALRKKER